MENYFELLEIKFINESKNFITASQVLQDSQQCSVENQMFLSQIIFMNRHACELLLKGLHFRLLKTNTNILGGYNIKLENIHGKKLNQSIFETHSLLTLYDSFISLSNFNLVIDKQKLTKFRKMVVDIDKIDVDSTYFRYPVDKDGNFNSRTYFINPEDPNINPDFNDYSFDQIYIDEQEGIVRYINLVPEAIDYNNKLKEFYSFLTKTQESF